MFKFSVIVTVYNKEAHIAKTLKSVFDQTVKDFEVIVVNDGSTDRSLQVLKQFTDPRLRILDQENLGASAARNRGIMEASGKFIALLDGDDFWMPGYLEEIENLQQSFPGSKVFATAVEIGSPNGFFPSQYSFRNPKNKDQLLLDYFESSYQNTLLTSSSIVVKRKVFDKIGLFDESIKSGQDTDMWIRIGLKYRTAFSTKIRVRYNFVYDSLANTSNSLCQKIDLEKFREEEKNNPQLQKFIDLNRYSFAIKAKLWNDEPGAERFRESIDPKNLNQRQRFLLRLNRTSLRLLIRIKGYLEILGLRLSAFRS